MSQRLEFGAVLLGGGPVPTGEVSAPKHPTYHGPNRRSLHPIDLLARRLDPVCSSAVDPWQIAAVLESDGINDRIAREEYGFADVFELAEELFRRVPLRIPVAPRRSRRFRVRRALVEVAHGPLLAAPVVFLAALLGLTGAAAVFYGALAGLVLGWAWSLGAIRLGEGLAGRGLIQEAARVLRLHLATALALTGLALALALNVRGPWQLAAQAGGVAAGLVVWLLSARVLIGFGREGWAAFALLPGLLLNAAHLLFAHGGVSGAAAATGSSLSAILAGLAGIWVARSAKPPSGAFLAANRKDLREAWRSAAFGALCALPVVLEALRWTTVSGRGLAAVALHFAPLALGAGVIGWQLRRFLERSREHLRAHQDPAAFVRRVRLGLLAGLARTFLILGLLSALAYTLGGPWRLVDAASVERLAANVLLGGGLLLCFLLAMHQHANWAFWSLGVTVLLEVALWALAPTLPRLTSTRGVLVGYVALFLIALTLAWRSLAQLRQYRF